MVGIKQDPLGKVKGAGRLCSDLASSWYGMVCYSMVWYGCFSMVWYGTVYPDPACQSDDVNQREVTMSTAGVVWYGVSWFLYDGIVNAIRPQKTTVCYYV